MACLHRIAFRTSLLLLASAMASAQTPVAFNLTGMWSAMSTWTCWSAPTPVPRWAITWACRSTTPEQQLQTLIG